MMILIAGASGFVGKKLVQALAAHHSLIVVGRNQARLLRDFPASVRAFAWSQLHELDAKSVDVVINLSGLNIAASRWNARVKRELIDSRVDTSTQLIEWAMQQHAKPRFICANAVGIYGMQDPSAMALDEQSAIDLDHPRDFLSEIGIRWQQALQPAVDDGMNVVTTRFGVVLAKDGGMLKQLRLSFMFGLGSVLGDGEQVISWVHADDVVGAMLFLLEHPQLSGAFNITSPFLVTQREFAHALAKTMHRPLWLTLPSWLIHGLLGEMGDSLLLKGQRVVPSRLLEEGYGFKYPHLLDALSHGCV